MATNFQTVQQNFLNMVNELENPFSVTKATEFNDEEINEYWVSFNPKQDVSIESFLNPREFLPKYIIGSKGCGKTHILRYFSFPLQCIRKNNNVSEVLSNDKYIGVYSILGGLNSSRFKGKNIEEAQWQSVFEYYFELYILDSLLRTILSIIRNLDISKTEEERIVQEAVRSFTNSKSLNALKSFESLIEYVKSLRDKIDEQILNAAFLRKLDYEEVKILFNPGDLIFGMPLAVTQVLPSFAEVKFIFILDEYEKLFEWQKVFINTLVWDKKNPVTFWIGARRYGYTTRDTKSGEPMKKGSEFEPVDLDFLIKNDATNYKTFAKKLYGNRLVKFYQRKNIQYSIDEIAENFSNRFETYSEDDFLAIISQQKKKEFPHIRHFRKKLSWVIGKKYAFDIKNEKDVDSIVASLVSGTENNILFQKYKLFSFYKLWSKIKSGDSYFLIAKQVNDEFKNFVEGKSKEFDDIKDKRKKDFMAQIFKENNIASREYSGVDKFIELSEGNSRSFILSLKKTIEFAKIRGENPLDQGGCISLDSQYLAINDTARWFYEDAEVVGESGKHMYQALRNLTDLFSLCRYSDKPAETTVSSFYIKGECSQQSIEIIELMKMHSMIIEDENGRAEKNSGRPERKFQLAKILAPMWDIPAVVRGTLSFDERWTNGVFDKDHRVLFDQLFREKKASMNAPDFLRSNVDEEDATLF
jgi:hypothetical protein